MVIEIRKVVVSGSRRDWLRKDTGEVKMFSILIGGVVTVDYICQNSNEYAFYFMQIIVQIRKMAWAQAILPSTSCFPESLVTTPSQTWTSWDKPTPLMILFQLESIPIRYLQFTVSVRLGWEYKFLWYGFIL